MPHFERLYDFACWLTRDRQEAEDLVQETYAKALEDFPAVGETPESALLQRSDGQLVRQDTRSTAFAHRENLLLREVEGMSYQEISATLAIPVGAVMSRLSSAGKALDDGLRLRFQKG